jgi:hypothetical protein
MCFEHPDCIWTVHESHFCELHLQQRWFQHKCRLWWTWLSEIYCSFYAYHILVQLIDYRSRDGRELRDPVATVLNVNIDYIKSTLWRGSSYTFSWWLHHALLLIKMPSLLLAVPITNPKQTSLWLHIEQEVGVSFNGAVQLWLCSDWSLVADCNAVQMYLPHPFIIGVQPQLFPFSIAHPPSPLSLSLSLSLSKLSLSLTLLCQFCNCVQLYA